MTTKPTHPAQLAQSKGRTIISIDMAALEKLIAAGQTPPQITLLLRTPATHVRDA